MSERGAARPERPKRCPTAKEPANRLPAYTCMRATCQHIFWGWVGATLCPCYRRKY